VMRCLFVLGMNISNKANITGNLWLYGTNFVKNITIRKSSSNSLLDIPEYVSISKLHEYRNISVCCHKHISAR
jgi:hypothetical protein